MMSKYTYVCNTPDFKDINGNWIMSYNPVPYECWRTRAGVLWASVNKRSKVDGVYQKEHPTYIGTTNGFIDFQEFAEWCQDQYGYMLKEENGNYWQLDKDLTEHGNKEYCKEKCLFVPTRINSLLTASRGEYPLGVSRVKSRNKFRTACCDVEGKIKHLGYFLNSFEAHQAWQKYKIKVMKNILLTDDEVKKHGKLMPIIEKQIQRIQNDLDSGVETQ